MTRLTAIALTALSIAYLLWFALIVVYVLNDPQPGTPLVMLLCSFGVPPCVYTFWQCLKAFWPDEAHEPDVFS